MKSFLAVAFFLCCATRACMGQSPSPLPSPGQMNPVMMPPSYSPPPLAPGDIRLFTFIASARTNNNVHQISLDYRVKAAHVARLPKWSPQDGTPIPLSVGRTLDLFWQATRNLPVAPTIVWFELHNHKIAGRVDIWFYEIKYRINPGGPDEPVEPFRVLVLLDGSFLSGREETTDKIETTPLLAPQLTQPNQTPKPTP